MKSTYPSEELFNQVCQLHSQGFVSEISYFLSTFNFRRCESPEPRFEAKAIMLDDYGAEIIYISPDGSMQIFFREDNIGMGLHPILKVPQVIYTLETFKYLLFCKLFVKGILNRKNHREFWEKEPGHPFVHFGKESEKVRKGTATRLTK